MTESGYCVTLSEPPKSGESNRSELFRASAVCSLRCLTDCIRLSTFLAQIPRQTRDNRGGEPLAAIGITGGEPLAAIGMTRAKPQLGSFRVAALFLHYTFSIRNGASNNHHMLTQDTSPPWLDWQDHCLRSPSRLSP